MSVRCLLVHPRFSEFSFWNFKSACAMAGYRYNTQPLGLLTVAALLPRDWECRLVDMNADELDDSALDWADVVMTGGMITQQLEVFALIERAHARGKPVAVGGPDPTSQPGLYSRADFLVLGEGELTVPAFVRAWRAGERSGRFDPGAAKADMAASPPPRFDLARLSDYLYVGIQFSRGCPYTCEFCDIIELFGRVPRRKSPAQVIAELEALLAAGHRGHVDFVDDNFIGDKKAAKELLRALIAWSEARGWPFYFSTEATLTAAADPELLGLLRECDFRFLFVGVETPDPDLLKRARKLQNTLAPVAESVERISGSGMMVLAGFIVGFDGERAGAAEAVADCVEQARIPTAMVGLLTSLPNTQLDRRLIREGRLLVREGGAAIRPEETDQMTGGLNFLTSRPRAEVLREYRAALERIYSPAAYFARVRRMLEWLRPRRRHRTPARAIPRLALTLLKATLHFCARPRLALHYLRTLAFAARLGPAHFTTAAMAAVFYVHLERQTRHVVGRVGAQVADIESSGEREHLRKREILVFQA